MNVNKLMRSLAAKTNPNDSAQWLPLWMHARNLSGKHLRRRYRTY